MGQASASVDAYKEMMGGNYSMIDEIQRLRDQHIVTERGAAMAKAEMAAAQKQTAEMAAKVRAHQESENTMASVLGTAVEANHRLEMENQVHRKDLEMRTSQVTHVGQMFGGAMTRITELEQVIAQRTSEVAALQARIDIQSHEAVAAAQLAGEEISKLRGHIGEISLALEHSQKQHQETVSRLGAAALQEQMLGELRARHLSDMREWESQKSALESRVLSLETSNWELEAAIALRTTEAERLRQESMTAQAESAALQRSANTVDTAAQGADSVTGAIEAVKKHYHGVMEQEMTRCVGRFQAIKDEHKKELEVLAGKFLEAEEQRDRFRDRFTEAEEEIERLKDLNSRYLDQLEVCQTDLQELQDNFERFEPIYPDYGTAAHFHLDDDGDLESEMADSDAFIDIAEEEEEEAPPIPPCIGGQVLARAVHPQVPWERQFLRGQTVRLPDAATWVNPPSRWLRR